MAERLIRIGKVSSVNKSKGLVSVTYPDLDDSVTGEFPCFSFMDEYSLPPVGADVLVLHLSNGQSAGVVMGRYWNDSRPPVNPAVEFRKDLGSGAYLECQNGSLKIHAANIVLEGDVSAGDISTVGTVTAGTVSADTVTANGTVSGQNLSVNGAVSAQSVSVSASVSAGSVISAGNVSANGISLTSHTHTCPGGESGTAH